MFGTARDTTSAVHSSSGYQGSGAFDVAPDDRIGVPRRRRQFRTFLLRLLTLALLGGGSWAAFEYQTVWQGWIAELTPQSPPIASKTQAALIPTSATTTLQGAPIDIDKPANSDRAARPTADKTAATLKTDTPQVAPITPVPVTLNAATPKADEKAASGAGAADQASTVSASSMNAARAAGVPAASTAYTAPAVSASPVLGDQQRRAGTAGLHPDLSHVVLARLSNVDYQNAGAAIKKALAETGDDDALLWPRQRKSGEALFKVHFVTGAATDCRRYVVTIAKDGWLTTSLPMEKCGVKRTKQAHAQKSPAASAVHVAAP